MNEQSIFLAALDFTDPVERSEYLIKACEGNTTLLQNVKALLASHEKSGNFLDMPAVKQMAGDACVTMELGATTREEIDLSFLAPSTKPDSLGTLAHYEIRQVLGRGGFGTVLKAFDEKLHRLVAIKVLSRELAATSPPRKRYLREARSVAAIKNENVIAIHSVEEQPLPYFVMEFVDGATLQDKMDEAGPIEVSEILHIGKQIASGLAAAHALGLIHRDIKPANILLEKGGVQKVKITDFGLARAADDASMTQSGMIAGTPLYMAPEQAKGAKLDARTDLFSLGSVLYALATGHPPFRAPSTFAVLRRVTEDTPRPMQQVISDIPDWLVAIVDKLLAKEPDDRFQSAQELVDVLAQCQYELQAGLPVSAEKKLGVTRRTPPVPLVNREAKLNKFPIAGVAAGVMLMFMAMASGLLFLNRNHSNSTVGLATPATPEVPLPSPTAAGSNRSASIPVPTTSNLPPAEPERAQKDKPIERTLESVAKMPVNLSLYLKPYTLNTNRLVIVKDHHWTVSASYLGARADGKDVIDDRVTLFITNSAGSFSPAIVRLNTETATQVVNDLNKLLDQKGDRQELTDPMVVTLATLPYKLDQNKIVHLAEENLICDVLPSYVSVDDNQQTSVEKRITLILQDSQNSFWPLIVRRNDSVASQLSADLKLALAKPNPVELKQPQNAESYVGTYQDSKGRKLELKPENDQLIYAIYWGPNGPISRGQLVQSAEGVLILHQPGEDTPITIKFSEDEKTVTTITFFDIDFVRKYSLSELRKPTKVAGTLRRSVRGSELAMFPGLRHMECANYFACERRLGCWFKKSVWWLERSIWPAGMNRYGNALANNQTIDPFFPRAKFIVQLYPITTTL